MDSEEWHSPIHYEKGGTFEYESKWCDLCNW